MDGRPARSTSLVSQSAWDAVRAEGGSTASWPTKEPPLRDSGAMPRLWASKSAHAVSEMFKGQLPFQAGVNIVQIPALLCGDGDLLPDTVEK